MFDKNLPIATLLAFLSLVIFRGQASALPWDTDLFKQESFRSNEMARAPVEGTVPVGFEHFDMSLDQAESELSNPEEFSTASVWRGRHLWNANCRTCHGIDAAGTSGPVGPQVGAPKLTDEIYKNRKDGRIFAIIYNGGVNMPRYGYKFSRPEIWDIVNYLRFLQGRDVDGIERPTE